jgi:hypothetical protein
MKRIAGIFSLLCVLGVPSAQAAGDTEKLQALLEESAASYENVQDYRAVFYKQEISKGEMGPREKIFVKFEKPFKIFMLWMDTHKKGLQVFYERGKHDNKLGIHKPGLLLGLAQVVFLPQDSPWVREGSEAYNIEDAGIGTFLADFEKMVRKGIAEGKIEASLKETPEGTLADVSFPGTEPKTGYFAQRVEALFDAGSRLPVLQKLYGWDGGLKGTYEYTELALNVGAKDPDFEKIAHRRLYKLYVPAEPRAASAAPKNNFARTV